MSKKLLAVLCSFGIAAGFPPEAAKASDGERLLNAIIGTGAQILLNETLRRRETPPESERPRQNAPANSGPRSIELTSSQVAEAQRLLNELGYDTGKPDGVAGGRTRDAIRQYQRDHGMKPTGNLTRQQFAVLASPSSPSPVPAAVSADDVPLTKSEMANVQRALSAIGFEVGKIDGIAGTATGKAIAAFLTQRGLDPYQTPVREAQRLILAAAGEPVAEPEHAATAATQPTDTTLEGTQPSAIVDVNEAGYALYDARGTPAASAEAFARRLALATVKVFPGSIESAAAAKTWFDADNPFNSTRPPTADRQAYEKANIVERDRLLSAYRERIRAEAQAVELPSAGRPWRVAIVTRAEPTGYTPGRGINFSTSWAYHLESKAVHLSNDYLRVWLVGSTPQLPDIQLVPTANDEESSRLLDRIKQDRAVIVTYLSLTRIGSDDVLGETFVHDSRNVPLSVTIDKVTLNSVREIDRYSPVPGDVLLPLGPTNSNPVSTEGTHAAAAGRAAGLAVLDGHVVLSPVAFYDVPKALAPKTNYQAAQQRFLDLLGYNLNPPIAFSDEVLAYLGNNILNQAQKVRVFGTEYYPRFDDEFERRAGIETLQKVVMPQVLAEASKLPAQVVAVRELSLEEYDFDAKRFSLGNPHTDNNAISLRGQFGPSSLHVEYLKLPQTLDMPEGEARALLTSRAAFNRHIYLATFGEIRSVSRNSAGQSGLGLEPSRVVLFADESLTRILAEYPVAEFVPPAEFPVPTLSADELRALDYQWMRQNEGTTTVELAVTTEDFSNRDDLVDMLTAASGSVRSSDPIARAGVTAKVRETLTALAVSPDRIRLPGRIKLGEFDVMTGAFPVSSLSLWVPNNGAESFDADFRVELANGAMLRALQVAPEAAQLIIARVGNSELEIRLDSRLVAAGSNADPENLDIDLSVYATDLHLLVPGRDRNLPFVQSVAIPEPPRVPDTASDAPLFSGRPVLTPDMLAVMALGRHSEAPSELALRSLYVDRYLFDTEQGSALPAFFRTGGKASPLQFDIDKDGFVAWLTNTATAIPDEVTIIWQLGAMNLRCGQFERLTSPSPALEGGLDADAQQKAIAGLVSAVRAGVMAGPSVAEGVLLEAAALPSSGRETCWSNSLRDLRSEHKLPKDYDRSLVVVLDYLPVYEPDWGSEWLTEIQAEIDIRIDRTELVDNANRTGPHVRAFATVQAVRYVEGVDRKADGHPNKAQPTLIVKYDINRREEATAPSPDAPQPAQPAGGNPDDLILQNLDAASADDAILSGLKSAPPAEVEVIAPAQEINVDKDIMSFAVSASGRLGLVGSENYLALWDLQEQVEVRKLLEFGGYVRSIAWSPDGRSALTVHGDGALRSWDLTTGTAKASLPNASRVAFATADTYYAASNGEVVERRLRDGSEVRKVAEGGTFWRSLRADRMVVLNGNGVEIVDLGTAQPIRRIVPPEGTPVEDRFETAAISSDGTQVAIGTSKGRISLWNIADGKKLIEMNGHVGRVMGISYTDEKRIASVDDSGELRIWSISDGVNIAHGKHGNIVTIGGPFITADGKSVLTTASYSINRWALAFQ